GQVRQDTRYGRYSSGQGILAKKKKNLVGDDCAYLEGMISERSPAGMNSRIAPLANSRRTSEKSNLSDGSANVIFMSGDRVHASPRAMWAAPAMAAYSPWCPTFIA